MKKISTVASTIPGMTIVLLRDSDGQPEQWSVPACFCAPNQPEVPNDSEAGGRLLATRPTATLEPEFDFGVICPF